jgi:gamma-glutamylcyclotransferase (GGCT)/AIG2-like uncharacterized protein YtfP
MDDDGEILFVYGALMNPAERLRLLGRPVNASPAHLAGYARGKKRYYFVAKQIGVTTDGAILDGLTAHDLAILDEYEDVPTLYARERIEVLTADGRKIECWIYLPTSWAGSPLPRKCETTVVSHSIK